VSYIGLHRLRRWVRERASRPRGNGEWEITRHAASEKTKARLEPVTRLQAVTWKGIQPRHSRKADVESRFGKGTPSETRIAYRVDQIFALASYSHDGVVQTIRLPAAVQIDQQTIIAEYGNPTRKRDSDALLVWDYDSAGVSAEFTRGNLETSAVELDSRPAIPDTLSSGVGAELVPIRPALSDLAERRGRILNAMKLSSDAAYSLCTGESEKIHAQQYVDQLAALPTAGPIQSRTI
jgi:hypothetical protein